MSLYIPGFDPQPLSVTELGVDTNGHTTWEIQPGQTTGGGDVGFLGTGTFTMLLVADKLNSLFFLATLVEGPSDAVISYVQVAETCTFSGSLAICDVDANGSTFQNIETIQPFVVAGSAGVVTASPSATAAATTATSSKSSGQSSGGNSHSSGAANPTQTAINGSNRVSAAGVAVLAVIGVLMVSVCC